ncbi:hypothetical protein ACOMHN_020694 [Nucella lapillus]
MKQVLFVAVCLGVLACVFSTGNTTTNSPTTLTTITVPTTIAVLTNTTRPTTQAPSNATTPSGMNVTTTGSNGAESVCRTTGLLMVAAIALDRFFH